MSDSGAESLQGYGDFLLKDFGGLSRLTVAKIESRHLTDLPRVETKRLTLPTLETANLGPSSGVRQPDPLEPEQVALALFDPMGNTRLGKQLGIGSGKAARINDFARQIRQWALSNGYNCLESVNRTGS
jgi:hypothetical protein